MLGDSPSIICFYISNVLGDNWAISLFLAQNFY